jgi:hypothetical protein
MKIFKKRIPIKDEFSMMLPANAKILCFGLQNDQPTIWYLDDSIKVPSKEFKFHLRGTGHEIDPHGLTYIGTVVGHRGWAVWHLFKEN